MTMIEMAGEYRGCAEQLRRRIAALTVALTQLNELTELLEHYYERGYYRSEKYRV